LDDAGVQLSRPRPLRPDGNQVAVHSISAIEGSEHAESVVVRGSGCTSRVLARGGGERRRPRSNVRRFRRN
jgi:hypothetical protein